MMSFLKRFSSIIRLLSIDVATGAVIMTNAVARSNGVILPQSVSIGIFFAVWFIYTLDHWLDARKIKGGEPSMPRHKFHRKYKKAFLVLLAFQFLAGSLNSLFLPFQIFYVGAAVAFSVGIYFAFSLLMKVVLVKEVLIASIYAIGVFVGPVSLGAFESYDELLSLVIVFGLAFVNLILIAMYEISFDLKDGSHSWPIKFGYKKSYFLVSYLLYILLALIGLGAFYVENGSWTLYVAFFLMTIVLYMILNRRAWFKKNERYRIFADVVFFIPGILLF